MPFSGGDYRCRAHASFQPLQQIRSVKRLGHRSYQSDRTFSGSGVVEGGGGGLSERSGPAQPTGLPHHNTIANQQQFPQQQETPSKQH